MRRGHPWSSSLLVLAVLAVPLRVLAQEIRLGAELQVNTCTTGDQRAPVVAADADGSVAPLTDGLLVLRYLFGFTGSTLVTGAVGGGCTLCDAGAIEAYLATLI